MNLDFNPKKIFRKEVITKKVLVIWGIYGVVSFALFSLLLVPNLRSYFKRRKQLKLLKNELSKYQRKARQLSTIDDQQLNLKIDKSLTVLPLYHSAPLIISILSKVGTENNITLGDINFSPGSIASNSLNLVSASPKVKPKGKRVLAKKMGLKELKLELKVKGSLDDLRHFLATLEKIRPLVVIDKVSLDLGSHSGSQSGEVNGSLHLSFFATKPPTTLPSLEDPLYTPTVNDEEKFQNLLQEYRGFTYVVSNTSSPQQQTTSRGNPFAY